MFTSKSAIFLRIALVIAIIATVTSLYFSEVKHFIPCILCWYQRICMYPLIPLMVIGMIRKEKSLPYYILSLSIPGTIIAFYHELLQLGVIHESLSPCSLGVSCTTRYITWLGFITIPFLSLMAFIVITACMLGMLYTSKKTQEKG